MLKLKLKSHNDLDGTAPGILAKIAFGERVEVMYCSNNNIDRAVERFLEKKENVNTFLYITDASVNAENEARLQERFLEKRNVLLFDHHKTALHLDQHQWANVKTEYEDGRKTCGTSMFFEHLVEEGLIHPTPSMIEFVELVRQYDTWEWEAKENFRAKWLNDLFYMEGIAAFEEKMIARLTENNNIFEFNELEKSILLLEEKRIQQFINQKQKEIKETTIGSYRIGIVHADRYHSEAGNVLAKNNPHLDLIALLNLGSQRMSFRTAHKGVDVSVLAKSYGGGGHQPAAGATLSKDTFQKYVADVFDVLPRKVDPTKNKYNVKASRFGTLFENHQNEMFLIKFDGDKWRIEDKEYEGKEFESFIEAESVLKREKNVWLSFDDVLIENFSKKYQINEQTLRSQFERSMESIC